MEGKKTENQGNVSRRKFLKILGAGAATTAAGCADKATQNVLPFVKGEQTQVPGVAVWYSSTCTECSAGCGVAVRTREGRAVKVEGNPDNPINRGGLCGLGQASLQALYDPDRVREPLQKVGDKFEPISWKDAYAKVATALKKDGKKAFITGEVSGSIESLCSEFQSELGVEHIQYDSLAPASVARAAELCYGVAGVPEYAIDKADFLLNFGADFLETWINPTGYARDFAKARKRKHPLKFIHIEPRLSLTGANADKWFSSRPGTEARLALALVKLLLERGRGSTLSQSVRSGMERIVQDVKVSEVAAETGVPQDKILLIAQYLHEAKSSLVLAGGATAATGDPLPLLIATNFLNLLLSNVGKTVKLSNLRKPRTSFEKVLKLIEDLNAGVGEDGTSNFDVLFVHGTNPAFSVPNSYGFSYAARNAGLTVSFSSSLDETARLADIVLPASHTLESWGDVEAVEGARSLIQPVMSPVFNTRSLGDIILGVSSSADKKSVGSGAKTFEEYLKARWQERFTALGSAERQGALDFETFWLQALERGGHFIKKNTRVRVAVDPGVFSTSFKTPKFKTEGAEGSKLVLFPYPSVKTFDGRAANRPWLQEIPDPVTQVAWDSWAEIHPDTAKESGLEQGDIVQIENKFGQISVPVFVTEHVQKEVVAVPMGQGHSAYGRYAGSVDRGDIFQVLPPVANASFVSLVSAQVGIKRGRGKGELVVTQGSDDQLDRGIGRTEVISEDKHDDHHGDGHHGGHHEPKQMYKQREHPLYKWGMAVDLAACTGCSACVVACYAENNIPVVGKDVMSQGREMSWLRIERYYDKGKAEELTVNFVPMMCQHCGNAPCEPVCPVYATYHNPEGLNVMVYNRCVGTRYCSNNCSYKVRRFNWYEFDWPTPLDWQLNPDVTKRVAGVMEKCSFCVQRIDEGKDRAKDLGRKVKDGEVKPACVQSCPTEALVFGNLNDPKSKVSKLSHDKRAYKVLDHHLNTQPSVSYLEDKKYKI